MSTILVKIDVTKIDKARLYKGKKGTYLDCALVRKEDDEYGNDFFVAQSVSKEERLAGKRGPIIGNAKFAKKSNDDEQAPKQPASSNQESDDPPF